MLEDALVEFNEMAEIEPKFFRKNFKDLFVAFSPIVAKSDFTNPTIRHQPVEFFVTVVERIPAVVKKDQETLKGLLDLIFKLMIDIDNEIEDSWMRPKEGFKADEEEEDEDAVHFGKTCVDRLVSSIGDEIMLPLLSQLVQATLANEADWRYKNAGLMALSQVGEYLDDIQKIAPMIPVVIQHLTHQNPKIRYAALHCIGQMADDMTEDFQETFHESVLPALTAMLDDPVPRVQAHACAAMTNFFEGTSEEIIVNYIGAIMPKLCNLVQVGISIIKENAVTALASLAEAAKENFAQYFNECLGFLCQFLAGFNEPAYKQFKGQVIEAATIISASVGVEKFLPHAPVVINAMLDIQNKQLDSKDPQRTYLLSAWQRICLLMGKEFAPFLPQVIPSLFQMATLNPEMSIQGSERAGDINDVLSEIKPADANEEGKKININTDEIEEKDVAIQMLSVFIDELGSAFAPYYEATSRILLSMIDYESNDSIRNSVAGALPGLVKCVKGADPTNGAVIVNISKMYLEALWKAIKKETETDTLICQVQAAKEIIDEVGEGLLDQGTVELLAQLLIEKYHESDNRIKENNEMAKQGGAGEGDEDEEDALDQDEMEVIKEENNNEYDLQLSIAEIIGILFKTHGGLCQNIVSQLFQTILPQALQTNEKQKIKFALFVMDDMVEFLGPAHLGPHYVDVAKQIISHCSSNYAAVRQAASYGIGIMAEKAGAAFAQISNDCLVGLKNAIEFAMPASVKEKKTKVKQFMHAKDNAVSALGKIIKFQSGAVDTASLIPNWLGLLPIKNDIDEAKVQNELVADLLAANPVAILGEQYQRFEQVVILLSDITQKKYVNDETGVKLSNIIKGMASDATFSAQFNTVCANKLTADQQERIKNALNFTQ